MAGLELRRQFGSFAVAVRSAATRGPNGLGGAVLDVINPAAETVGDVGLYLPHLGTGLANKPVACAPVVLGTGQSRRYRATNDDESKAMADPRVRTVGSANRLRAPHVDRQQLHGTSALGPRVAACSVALPTEQCASATIEEISQKVPGVRRFYALRDVGLFRRTAPCAAVHLAVRQMGPLSSISAVRIFECVPAGADFDY